MSEIIQQTLIWLRAARVRISRPEKWGNFHPLKQDRVDCLTTALDRVAQKPGHEPGWLPSSDPAYQMLWEALPEAYRKTPEPCLTDIWVYNDAPERTHAEALAVYDRAIARTEAILGAVAESAPLV